MAGVLPAGRCVLIVPYPKQSTCTVNIPPPVSSPFSSSATVLEISHTRLLRTALLFVVGLFLSSVLILLPFQGYYLVFRYLKTLSMGFRVDLAQCKLPAKQIIALSRRDETGGWLCCCCFLSKAVFLRLLSSGRKKKKQSFVPASQAYLVPGHFLVSQTSSVTPDSQPRPKKQLFYVPWSRQP